MQKYGNGTRLKEESVLFFCYLSLTLLLPAHSDGYRPFQILYSWQNESISHSARIHLWHVYFYVLLLSDLLKSQDILPGQCHSDTCKLPHEEFFHIQSLCNLHFTPFGKTELIVDKRSTITFFINKLLDNKTIDDSVNHFIR